MLYFTRLCAFGGSIGGLFGRCGYVRFNPHCLAGFNGCGAQVFGNVCLQIALELLREGCCD